MKKLLYILPIIILLLSCSDDAVSNKDSTQKYVYGIDRYLSDGTFVETIGEKGTNFEGTVETIRMIAFPNPAVNELCISIDVSTERSYKIFMETAIGNDDFLEKLDNRTTPIVFDLPILNYYEKKLLHEGRANVGSHFLKINLINKSPGVYYLVYEDSNGIQKYIAFIKNRS